MPGSDRGKFMTQSVIRSAHRIVVKVGSSLVTNDGKGLDHQALSRWAREIAELVRARWASAARARP